MIFLFLHVIFICDCVAQQYKSSPYLLDVRNRQQLSQSTEELPKQCLQITVILWSILSREDILSNTIHVINNC